MGRFWWQMPGPSRFVARVVQDIRDGKNILLQLPRHSPVDLYGTIRRNLETDDGGWHVRQITWESERHSSPLDMLARQYVLDDDSPDTWSIADLSRSELFRNQVIWLAGMTEMSWPAWHTFLTEYAHVCRSIPAHERSLLLVPLSGVLAKQTVTEDVCLSVHRWYGYVDTTDMLLYASHMVTERGDHPLRQRIIVAIIANLALWDPLLAERLANADMDVLFAPQEVLLDIASERGWTADTALEWHDGACDHIDGELRMHSAYVVLADLEQELAYRLWSAQMAVLLPYVEQRRRSLLRQLGHHLRVPFYTQDGTCITDIRDLELGHICHQLNTGQVRVGSELRDYVKQLRNMRNQLAHLDIVHQDELDNLVRWDKWPP